MVFLEAAALGLAAYGAYQASQGVDTGAPPLTAKEIRRLGRATFHSTPGAADTLAGLEGLLEQARNLPVDPGLEQQIVAGVRQQAGLGQPSGRTPAGYQAPQGITREAVGAAISGAEAIRDSTFLRRFQAQQGVLNTLAQQTRAGFRGGPTEQLVQERAAINATRAQIQSKRNSALLRGAGTAISALSTLGAVTDNAVPVSTGAPSAATGIPIMQPAAPGAPIITPGNPMQINPFDIGLMSPGAFS